MVIVAAIFTVPVTGAVIVMLDVTAEVIAIAPVRCTFPAPVTERVAESPEVAVMEPARDT